MQERKKGGGAKRGDKSVKHEVRAIIPSSLDGRLTAFTDDCERTSSWVVRKALDEFLKTRNY